MKNTHLLCPAAVALWLVGAPAARAQGIAVTLNGDPIPFPGQSPIQTADGTILVPMRAIFERLGAQVKFVAATRTITATRGATNILLRIGEAAGYVNEVPKPLPVPAQSVNGATLVPLRFVSEALGAQVSWELATRTVRIVAELPKPAPVEPPTPPAPAPSTAPVRGTLTALDAAAKTITVEPDGMPAEKITLASDAVVLVALVGGETTQKDLGALRVGDAVFVKARNAAGEALVVEASVEERSGIVKSIDAAPAGDGKVVVFEEGAPVEVPAGVAVSRVDPQTKLVVPATLEEIKPGERAVIRLNPARKLALALAVTAVEPPPPPKVEIAKVIHNGGSGYFKTGQEIQVTVQGTPGAKGVVKIPGLAGADALPLTETTAGSYVARFTIPDGVLLRDIQPVATLTLGTTDSPMVASADTLSIDGIAPAPGTLAPAEGAELSDLRPQLTATYADTGSGIDARKIQVLLDGADVTAASTVTDSVFSYKPPADLVPGRHVATLVLRDTAGNETRREWAFTVLMPPLIKTFTLRPDNKPLDFGDIITFKVDGQPAAQSAIVTIGEKIKVTLREDSPGTYVGSYTLRPQDGVARAAVTATLTWADGRTAQQAAEKVLTLTAGAPDAPVIDLPQEGASVGNSVILSGRSLPNATIKITVRYEGKKAGLLQTRKVLQEVTVRADMGGRWKTDAILLKLPREVSGATFTAEAVAEGTSGASSAPATVRFRR